MLTYSEVQKRVRDHCYGPDGCNGDHTKHEACVAAFEKKAKRYHAKGFLKDMWLLAMWIGSMFAAAAWL